MTYNQHGDAAHEENFIGSFLFQLEMDEAAIPLVYCSRLICHDQYIEADGMRQSWTPLRIRRATTSLRPTVFLGVRPATMALVELDLGGRPLVRFVLRNPQITQWSLSAHDSMREGIVLETAVVEFSGVEVVLVGPDSGVTP